MSYGRRDEVYCSFSSWDEVMIGVRIGTEIFSFISLISLDMVERERERESWGRVRVTDPFHSCDYIF